MATVSFGGPLEFGAASFGDTVTRNAQNESVPSDAIVTASIAPASTLFSITSVTAYNVAIVDVPLPPGHVGPPLKKKVYTQTGRSDGKTPLPAHKGQEVDVLVELAVPTSAVTPGDVAATLAIHGDTWGKAAEVALHGTLLTVDEGTPIGEKWRELGALAFSGAVLANAQTMPDALGAFQTFENGAIVYSPDFGAAWLAQPIFAKLNSPEIAQGQGADGENIRDYLGYPTGDTFPTIERGGQAAIFTRGIIVVRARGAAFVVYGLIYGHYANLGNIAAGSIRVPVVGLPLSDEEAVPNGRRSRFDGGDIYWKGASGAWEVHGAIRGAWDALGGPKSFLGYPTTDEVGVMNGATEIGRSNTFENATMFWSGATGGFECHGEILKKYLASGGPAGALGFPTTNETDTPGGGRYNAFQNGLIVWHGGGTYAGAFTVGNSLQLQLFSYQDSSHDDFNVQVHLDDSRGQKVRVRMPAADEYGNGNVQFDPPVTLLAANGLTSDYTIDVWMLCIHEVTFGSDDEDGTVTAHFDIDNLWGVADSPLYANGAFHVDMKSMPQPQIFASDPAHFRTNLFWPFHNWSTSAMTWTQFSETFTNVGEGDLSFNVLPWNWHLWERAFFQLVYRGIAAGGNCFGMCLESIYAREYRAPFVEPIYNSPDNTYSHDALGVNPDPANANDTAVIDRVNVKMGYQVGADFINWFIGMEIENDIQDAVLAFKSSRDAYARGNWPMIMLSPSALSQDGHVVVPYRWLVSFDGAPPIDASDEAIDSQPLPSQAWIMRVANPNATPDRKPDGDVDCEIRISPFANTWTFTGGDGNWSGSKGSDGRIFCAPYSLLNYEPAMVGDFILGLLQGLMVVIFSGDGETQQITDDAGRTYFAPAARQGLRRIVSAERPQREINRDPRTRIPDMGFVPTYHTARVNRLRDEAVPPYEIYCIRRPAPTMRWPQPGSRQFAPRTQALSNATQDRLFAPVNRENELTYQIAAARSSPYRWNLSAPRVSVDVVCGTAADALDEIRVTGGGSASQTITLRTDAKGAVREFELTVAGWRGNDRSAKKAFSLQHLSLAPGAALSAGLNDGGKELWLYNAGATLTCLIDVYTAHRDTPLITNHNLKLPAGTTMRLRPSDWTLVDRDATLCIETVGSHGHDHGTTGTGGQDYGHRQQHHRHEREDHTGKIGGLMFDHFGDFEGFILETDEGERRYFSRETEIGTLAERAWSERLRITVIAECESPGRPRKIIVRHPPSPFKN